MCARRQWRVSKMYFEKKNCKQIKTNDRNGEKFQETLSKTVVRMLEVNGCGNDKVGEKREWKNKMKSKF